MKIFYSASIIFTFFLCIIASPAKAQTQSFPCFIKSDTFEVGTTPVGTVEADFNGDSISDVATLNNETGINPLTGNTTQDITILLGNGKGSLSASPSSPLSLSATGSSNLYAINTGDYDGNGFTDIAVAGYQQISGSYYGIIYVFYNNIIASTPGTIGTNAGTFTGALINGNIGYAGSTSTVGLATADFDNDKKSDLVFTTNVDVSYGAYVLLSSSYFYPTGIQALAGAFLYAVTSGNFNNDTVPDIAVTNSGALVVLLGKDTTGTVKFTPTGSPYTVGTYTTSITTGDFNGDGLADLAGVNYSYTDAIYVLFNSASGGIFNAPITLSASNTASNPISYTEFLSSIVSGDFNQDGYADIAAISYYTTLSVTLSNGKTNNFGAASIFPTYTTPIGLTTGDFNGDSKTDIAVANQADNEVELFIDNFHNQLVTISGLSKTYCGNAPSVVLSGTPAGGTFAGLGIVYEGITDSLFSPESALLSSQNTITTAVVTYNYVDANGCAYPVKDTSTIFPVAAFNINNGLSSKTFLINAPSDTITISPAGGTYKGAGMSDTFSVSYDPGYTAAAFSPSAAGAGSHAIIYTYTDTVAANTFCLNSDTIIVTVTGIASVSNSTQTSTQPLCFSIPGSYPPGNSGSLAVVYSVVTGDFNGDGEPDIAAANQGTENYAGNGIYVYNNQGRGNFTSTSSSPTGIYNITNTDYHVTAVVSGYFDGDNRLDLATANTIYSYSVCNYNVQSGNVSIFVNDSVGPNNYSFSDNLDYSIGYNPVGIIAADFNNDGLTDIATSNQQGQPPTSCRVAASAVARMDDVITSNPGSGGLSTASPTVSVLLNTVGQAGTFTENDYLIPSASSPAALVAGDFNNDGFKDIATVDNGSNTVAILYNDQTGAFGGANTVYTIGQSLTGITTGDFNGDKIPDLAVSDYGSSPITQPTSRQAATGVGTVYIFLGSGAGASATFITSQFPANASPNNIISGDFNKDGKPDLMTANDNGSVSVYIGDGTGLFAQAGNFNEGGELFALDTADFNGDKKPDFVTSDITSNNAIEVLLNDFNKVTVTGVVNNGIFCLNESPAVLFGNPAGGVFSGRGVKAPKSQGVASDSSTFSPLLAGAGKDTIIYSYTNVGGCTFNDSIFVSVSPKPAISGLDTSSSHYYCSSQAPIVMTVAGIGTFSGAGVGTTYTPSGSSDTVAAVFAPSSAGSGRHAIVYTSQSGCGGGGGGSNADTVLVTVRAAPLVVFAGIDSVYCRNAPAITLNGNPSGGKFKGPGVDSLTHVFTPASVPGTDTIAIVYSLSKGGCTGYDTLYTHVHASVAVSFTGLASSYCYSPTPAPALLTGLPSGGTFSDAEVAGAVSGNAFSPTAVGIHRITYSYVNPANGCVDTSTQTTDVYSVETINFTGLNSVYCINTQSVDIVGFPTGGSFTLNGSSALPGGVFSPSAAGPGQYSVAYTLVSSNGCSGSFQKSVSVYDTISVSFSGLDSVYCANSGPVVLSGSPTGGSFAVPGAPNGALSGSVFSPSAAGPGVYEVLYNFTDNNGCAYVDTLRSRIYPLVPLSIKGLSGSYCANALSDTLVGIPSGGVFSGPGVYGDTLFSPSLAGPGVASVAYTYIDTINSGISCAAVSSVNVAVNALPSVSYAGLNSFYCISTPSVSILSGIPQGGTFSGDAALNGPTFSPSAAGLGTHRVTYSYTDVNGCSNSYTDSSLIYLRPPVSVSGFDSSYCLHSTASPILGIHPYNQGSASFTWTGSGLSDTVSTDSTFTPTFAELGKQSLAYSYTDSSGCSNDTTLYTVVLGLPSVTFTGLASSYCANADSVALSGRPEGGFFSGTGGGVFNDSVFYPSKSPLSAGTFGITYTYTDTNNCSNSYTGYTNITGLTPVSVSGARSSYCALEPVDTLVGRPRGGSLALSGGSYVSILSDSGLFSPTLFNAADSSEAGSIVYRYTDPVTGCTSVDSLLTKIYRVPSVAFLTASACYGSSGDTIKALAQPPGGVFAYSGAGVSGNLFNANTLPDTGVYAIQCVYTTSLGGCSGSYTGQVHVTRPSIKLSGLKKSYCFNEGPSTLLVSPYPGVYTSNVPAALAAGGPGELIFYPSAAGSNDTLTYSYTDINGCSATDTQTTIVNPYPSKPTATAPDSVCSNASLDLSASDATSGVSYVWRLPQSSGQSLSLSSPIVTGQNPVINPASLVTGYYTVKAVNSYDCASDSDSVYVFVKSVPLLPQPTPSDSVVCDFNAGPVYIASATNFSDYNWYLDGVKISGQHKNTLFLATTGSYTLEALDTNGCFAYSDPIIVSENSKRPVVTVQGYPLDSSLTSTHAVSYQWYVNSKRIIGETDSIIHVGYNGTYSVLAYYSSSCSEFSLSYTVDREDFTSITRVTSQTDSTITLPSAGPSSAASGIVIRKDAAGKNYYVEYTPVSDEELVITVTAMTGEVLFKKEASVRKGVFSSALVNVSNLAPAMYILNAATTDQSQYRKIIVE